MKWKIVRATVLGTAHIASNTPCQDDCFADVVSSRDGVDYLVCLVSDGAGSAKEGGTGAELACNTARSSIEAFLGKPEALSFDESIVVEWIKNIRLAIQETADSLDFTSRDFACTLLGAVIGLDNAVFFQIGDGAIVASNGCTQGVVFWPDSGQYANMTYFVTEEDAFDHLQIMVTNTHIDEVSLFSDGIQRLALSFDQQTSHLPFFDPMLKVLRQTNPDHCEVLNDQLVHFLSSSAINERTDDDKTLVLATRLSS